MALKYATLATVSAATCGALALIWMCAPDLPLSIWDVETSYQSGFVGRRCAALFAGLGVMLWLARHSAPSSARKAMSLGLAAGCCLLAVLGLVEYVTGHANAYILPAVLVETVLALSFLFVEPRSVET
ncbi:MAG: hypothetical protein HOP03_15190 [Lysobacter sp.]|nr:hypothetical protein [Lysobacter sp.]